MKEILLAIAALFLLNSCKITQYSYALISDRDEQLDVYISDTVDKVINITQDTYTDYGINWSPDGKQVIFAKSVNKQYDLFIYEVASQRMTQLTYDTLNQYAPSFSPDGQSILFVSNADDKLNEIYLMNLKTTKTKRITTNDRLDGSPTFHPDGIHIYYASFMDRDSSNGITNSEIFVTDTSGQEHVRLTNRIGNDGAIDISPDGKTLACHYFLKNKADIYIMDIDGSNIRQLTSDTLDNRWPRWTPDGRYIAYTRVAENSDIWIMQRNGKHQQAFVVSPKRDEILEFKPVK